MTASLHATTLLARHEWRRLFATAFAWLALALIQLILALLFLGSLWSIAVTPELLGSRNGVSDVVGRSTFGIAVMVMMLIIPVIASRMISEERRSGSWPLLLGAPVPSTAIVVGKLLAIAGMILVSTLLVSLMTLSLVVATDLDTGRLAAMAVGLGLMTLSCSALGLYISSLSRHSGIATIATLVALMLLWLLSAVGNIELTVAGGDLQLGAILRWLAPISHYDGFANGLLRPADTLWYLLFTVLFTSLCVLRVDAERTTRGRAATGRALICCLALIAVAASTTRLTSAYDWTDSRSNSLSASTQQLLDQFSDPINIEAYLYPDADRRRATVELVDRFRAVYPAINLEIVNPKQAIDRAAQNAISESGQAVIRYQGRQEVIRLRNEQSLLGALERLQRADETWLVFVTGHGERDIADTGPEGLSQLANRLRDRGIGIMALPLAEAASIPDNATAVVIAAGSQENLANWLPGERKLLNGFLDEGGNLLWLHESKRPDPKTSAATESDKAKSGAATLLPLTWSRGTVVYPDFNLLGTGHPALALLPDYPPHPVTRDLQAYSLLPFAAAVSAESNNGWRVAPLLRSPERSWLETGDPGKSPAFEPDNGDRAGPLTMAVALSRKPAGQDREQRIIAVADADFTSNAFYNTLGNERLIGGMLHWLMHRDDRLQVDANPAIDADLRLSPLAARVMAFMYVLALPLLLAGIGLLRWRRRQAA